MAFYKLPSAKKLNKFSTTFWALLVPAIFSLIFFNSYLNLTTPSMIYIAIFWGVSFTCIVLLQMHALAHVETNVLFPITTTLSLIITILIGILFFKEAISSLQLLGIILTIIIVFNFLYKKGKIQYPFLIILLGAIIILISVFNKVLQKLAADNFDIHSFQIYMYAFATIFILILSFISNKKNFSKEEIKVGSGIGIFSFFGGYSLLTALTKGSFSLIMSIHSFYIFITAIMGYILFKEQLTKRKIILILLAVLALILLRLG